jgi:hypothetical protein
MVVYLSVLLSVDQTAAARVALALIDQLLAGAFLGVVAGVIVGAIVWPIINEPDAMGRMLLLLALAAVGMALFEFTRIMVVTGSSLGSIIDAFQNQGTQIGQMVIQAGEHIGIAALVGAAVGVGSIVPGEAIKGALLGLAIGLLFGAGLHVLLLEIGLPLGPWLFRLLIGLVTWGVLSTLGGR